MIVDQNNRRGCIFDGSSKNFTRMHKARIKCSHGNLVGIDYLIFCIQSDNVKLFLFSVDNQALKKTLAKSDRFQTRKKCRAISD